MDTTARHGQENPRPPSPSALEELFDKFFDWPAFSRCHQPLDKAARYPLAASPSPDSLPSLMPALAPSLPDSHLPLDHLSPDPWRMRAYDEAASCSGYSGQSPPELVPGGSTSPSDHSGSLLSDQSDDGCPNHRPGVTLREAQAHDDEWTYPQTVPSKAAPYPSRLHVQGDTQSRVLAYGPAAGQKRRRPANDLDKRQRQLVDPVQTADVRKSGACLPCRVTKTRCHESGVCPTCRKSFPDHSHLVCTRKTPATAWPIITRGPDVWAADAQAEERLCSCPRKYIGKPREISIFLTDDANSPSLRATVQAYTPTDDSNEAGNPNKADFPRDHVPSHGTLQSWVEGQIKREQDAGFPQTLQKFLLAYSEGGRSLPKHHLVDNVHKMNCFFRIWRMSSFSCRDPVNNMAKLPLSVQARLRNIARGALKSLEYDVLKSLDECLSQHAQQRPQDKVAIWACLWQLILMYRDLLTAFRAKVAALTGEDGQTEPAAESYANHCRQLAEVYFPLVAIFYHYQFRTKKSLELSLDWLETGPYLRHAPDKRLGLRRLCQQLLDARKDMYQGLQASQNESDGLLCVLVVNHELKKLNARKRAPKAATKPKGPKGGGADDCDDDGE